ncbi:MAG TPA: hypothetical protein VGX03_07755, partial [Candidatus Binatia bacterium]|nr:hypothetical protein [Candidatus Binatia bacterium]
MRSSLESTVHSPQSTVHREEQPRFSLAQQEFQARGITAANLLSQAVTELAEHGVLNPRLDADVLLAYALGIDRAGLYARLHEPLSAGPVDAFRELLRRRARHEPLQYITGVQEFWSLEFKVDPRVLIP